MIFCCNIVKPKDAMCQYLCLNADAGLCNDIPLMLPSPPLSCIALQSNVEGRDSRLLHPCRAKLSSTAAVEWQKVSLLVIVLNVELIFFAKFFKEAKCYNIFCPKWRKDGKGWVIREALFQHCRIGKGGHFVLLYFFAKRTRNVGPFSANFGVVYENWHI